MLSMSGGLGGLIPSPVWTEYEETNEDRIGGELAYDAVEMTEVGRTSGLPDQLAISVLFPLVYLSSTSPWAYKHNMQKNHQMNFYFYKTTPIPVNWATPH